MLGVTAAMLGLGSCARQDNSDEAIADVAPAEVSAIAKSPLARDEIGFQGYGRDSRGYCRLAFSTKSESDAVHEFEADLGTRVDRYFPFGDGIIVEFRNGFRTAVWKNEIDCKDPPYDAFPAPEQPSVVEELQDNPSETSPTPEAMEVPSESAEGSMTEPAELE